MYVQPLNGEWEFAEVGNDDWMTAKVPGCVHLDLMHSGKIPDPFAADNEIKVQWVAETDWVYRKKFFPEESLLAEKRIYLECDGLDTLAMIRLNGQLIAQTANMFRRYEIEVTDKLLPSENLIEVEFRSPVKHVKPLLGKDLVISPSYSIPGSPYVRKAAYQWGWDWAPKIPTIGIWRPIRLVGRSVAKISDLHIRQTHHSEGVRLDILVCTRRESDGEVIVQARLIAPDARASYQESECLPAMESSLSQGFSKSTLHFDISDPQLWWPNGYGSQPLYILEVTLSTPASDTNADGCIVDKRTLRFGLRKVHLCQEHDRWGRSFYFRINDVPIFCKGANWIPADQFPSRIRHEQYRDLVESAAHANMNMLRIWGGGIYEDDSFYDLCDEYGILLWHDLMFSCAHYPSDEDFETNVIAEITDNVSRIRHHPCLALWCGNNEMEWGVVDWWPDEHQKQRQEQYKRLFHDIIPNLLKTVDPDIPYHPSSPSSPEPLNEPNSESEGDGHYWGVWHERKPFTEYRKHCFRFMSEFGFQSFPSLDTVKTFADPGEWNVTSYMMEQHQKHGTANEIILYYLAQMFRLPKNFEMMIYVSQILQALAIKYGVEYWRRNRNGRRCMGTLYWQFNDCWPVASWSSIEYNHHWKALHYFARRFYAPVLVSAEESDNRTSLYVTNDFLHPFDGELVWRLERLNGKLIWEGSSEVHVDPESSVQVCDFDLHHYLDYDIVREVVFCYELHNNKGCVSGDMISFVPPKHLNLPDPQVSWTLSEEDGKTLITLNTKETARFVRLEIPGHEVRFSDNYFDIPAGKSKTVVVEQSCSLSTSEIEDSLTVVSLRDSY